LSEIGLGLISCGNMGRSLVTHAKDVPGCSLRCVADVVEEKAKALAEEMGCDYVTDSNALLSRGDIDAVVVAAPNFLHRELVEQAAAQQKHVFCEKPLALTTADAKAMVAAAADNGVKLMVGQVLRYISPFPYIQQLVDGGELGEPFAMQTTRIGGSWGGHYHAQWRLRRETCGGPLFEVSAHEIDYMRQIMGEAKRVSAGMGRYVALEIDYEDLAMLLIDFQNGGYGQLLAGHAAFLGTYDVKLFLTQGTILCRPWPAEVRYKAADGDEVTVGEKDLEAEPGVRREMREFVECIQNDTPPTIPGEEGVRNVELAEAAGISAREGRPVDLPL